MMHSAPRIGRTPRWSPHGREVHPRPPELAAFAVARDPLDARWSDVRLHVDSDCRSCRNVVASLRNLDPFASVGGIRRPLQLPPTWTRPKVLASAAGVRTGRLADIKLVCGAGPFELDLLMRELSVPAGVSFAGQVTWNHRVHDPARNLDLALLEPVGQGIVATARTDRFGEFSFPPQARATYGLRLGIDEESPCVLVWEEES